MAKEIKKITGSHEVNSTSNLTIYTVPVGKVAQVIPTNWGAEGTDNATLKVYIGSIYELKMHILSVVNFSGALVICPSNKIMTTHDATLSNTNDIVIVPDKIYLNEGDSIILRSSNNERVTFEGIVIEEDIGVQ